MHSPLVTRMQTLMVSSFQLTYAGHLAGEAEGEERLNTALGADLTLCRRMLRRVMWVVSQ